MDAPCIFVMTNSLFGLEFTSPFGLGFCELTKNIDRRISARDEAS